MGGVSIPLPALGVNPPAPQQNPLDQYARLLQLKNQMAEQPLRNQALQQQVQEGGVDLQQKQQQLTDQKALTSAMQSWDGKDYNDLIPLALKKGASSTAVIGLKSKLLEQQTSVANAYKANAQGTEANVQAAKQKGDLLDGALTPLIDAKQTPDAALPQALTAAAQDLQQRGLLDPQHAQQVGQLVQLAQQNPTAVRQKLDTLRKSNMAQSQVIQNALDEAKTSEANANAQNAKGKIDPNSPLYSPSDAAVNAGTAPLAATIQQGKVKQAAAVAGADESARLPGEMALARQRQALSQGDPNAAGQLLANGDATLSELKSRGATPDFIARSLFAAKKINPAFNAMSSEAQFDVAKSPENVKFFGSAKSLTEKGGTLDQLADIAQKIPGNQIPALNSVADWAKAATGNGPLAKYAAVAVGAADDYAKVMGGGQGSDSSRNQALDLFKRNLSPDARAGSIDGVRGAVGSQIHARIGSNPVLQRMFGDVDAGANRSSSSPAAGVSVGSTITQGGHKYKVTAVDKDGKPTSADPL